MTAKALSGGCQCGAVRFRMSGPLLHPHICHCRMCQKASGNYFMPLAGVLKSEFVLTRGEMSWFQSSGPVRRGFCNRCGTPMAIDTLSSNKFHVMLGALDHPNEVKPLQQFGMESKMPWFNQLDTMHGTITEEDELMDQSEIAEIRKSNNQHPDHDTKQWLKS